MAKSKGSLKAALSQQQARLKKKAKAQEAAQVHEKTTKSAKAKGKEKATSSSTTTRSTVPFKTTDTILLIGEGNFSFASALFKHPALEHLPAANVTATAYDTEEECIGKYPDAKEHIEGLKKAGAELLFGVDATALEKCKSLRGRRFDRIVWNFPHAGA
jgi:25S rRNA (uracil2634-N3)-methyltransferase